MGTLQISAVSEDDDGEYDCIVTNGLLEVKSKKAILTVTNDPDYSSKG